MEAVPDRASEGSRFPLGRRITAIVSAFAYAGVAMLLISIVLTCADILWRRIVGGAFTDTVDITKLCLVAAASWSIPYGYTQGTHVTVDLIVERFPPAFRSALDALINLISAAFLVFLFVLAFGAAAQSVAYGDISPNLGIPMVTHWTILLIGLALAAVAALVRAVDVGIGWSRARRF